MFFYIDESGHTGTNLFDLSQPMLFYGVLSSRLNVDVLAQDSVQQLRRQLGVPRLHANEIGNAGLVEILGGLLKIQKRLDFRIDIYRVAKPDHAIISFFDQVFDQGMNPAITWTGYWTPLRYALLLKVASLFDEELAREAWNARICVDDATANAGLQRVCRALKGSVEKLPDARSRELIGDALTWAENNPAEISYNVASKRSILEISPNIIGFQMVMQSIADRTRKTGREASRIIVDQQSQFNKAQRTLAEFFGRARGVQLMTGPGMPVPDFSKMPNIPIEFASSEDSAALELVDLHLWVFRRYMEDRELAPELLSLMAPHFRRGRTDEISLRAIEKRWSRYYENIPEVDQMSDQQIARAREILNVEEERRLKAVRGIRGTATDVPPEH